MAGSQKSSNGTRKASNPTRKLRRARNKSKQPERKLLHLLKRNGLREAFDYASVKGSLLILRKLRPNYLEELRELGIQV